MGPSSLRSWLEQVVVVIVEKRRRASPFSWLIPVHSSLRHLSLPLSPSPSVNLDPVESRRFSGPCGSQGWTPPVRTSVTVTSVQAPSPHHEKRHTYTYKQQTRRVESPNLVPFTYGVKGSRDLFSHVYKSLRDGQRWFYWTLHPGRRLLLDFRTN